MITAEEFFRNKVKEQNPNREVITLSQELITAEQGMRWAHEFKQLYLHDVSGRSEQLKCHHQYMNAGTLQGDAMKKCLKCGDYVKAL